ncbi:response regulator transcription factor [Chloroflexota bacterium]
MVIEKDGITGAMIAGALEVTGFNIITTTDVLDGLKKIYESYPDAIIMATKLPRVNGENAYLKIRQATYVPLVVLGSPEERVETLELGVDAFMTKPPGLNELVARVKRLLQRQTKLNSRMNIPEADIENDLPLGPGADSLSFLSTIEFRLATCLIINRGKVLDYSQLINEGWRGKEVSLDTLHFYMHRLHQKLQVFFSYPIRISNVQGIGYSLEKEVD